MNIIDPDVGSYQFARGPVMLSDAPEIETNPAPELGEHTQEILKEILHYSESEIIEFENTKTIQTHKK